MNKKLIAAAVSAAVVAPVASYADVTVYGRINNALRILDTKDDNDVDLSSVELANVSSRVGVKASAEMGNGLTATARYEFSTFTDKEGVEGGHGGINDTRIGTVGISGGFGSINVGNQWSAYYNMVGTYMDPTYSLGYYLYSSAMAGPYRGSNQISYANTFGPVALQLDVRVQEEAEQNTEKLGATDGAGIGAQYNVNDNIVLAAAFDAQDGAPGNPDFDRAGVAASFGFGGFSIFGGWQETDIDGGATHSAVYLWGTAGLGDNGTLQVGYGSGEIDPNNGGATTDPDQFTFGYYHKMGGGLRLYYEGTVYDQDTGADDISDHLLGMRIDF